MNATTVAHDRPPDPPIEPPQRPPVAPRSIDRAAVDRILARALELQSSGSADAEGRLTEAQLEALAKEVGLDPINLRQALAEERTRIEIQTERGVLAALYGRAEVSAQRTVRGTPAHVLKALDDWMQRQEALFPQRYFGERIVWEVRRGMLGTVRRAVSGRGHALMRATSVGATVIAVDEGRVVVRLDAQFGGYRALMAEQNVALTGAGVLVAGVLGVLSFSVLAVAAPVVVLLPAGFALGRSSQLRRCPNAAPRDRCSGRG